MTTTTGRITNISLDKELFRVFVSYSNEVEEYYTFTSEVTAQEIRDKVTERCTEFDELEAKRLELVAELIIE
ncbi:MAG: hypothetical protein KBB88_01055 [Candidatus Pacebacteria bacterium]|nr:hypothetical protein [Candidatus Paceibacterota bacterium]